MYDYDEIVAGLVTDRPRPVPYLWVDWNRVEYATEAMAALVTKEGYYVTIVTKTNWNANDVIAGNFPTVPNISRYYGNISLIQQQFGQMPGVDLPRSIYGWGYADANKLELFLRGIPAAVAYMMSKYRRCNTFNCGTK